MVLLFIICYLKSEQTVLIYFDFNIFIIGVIAYVGNKINVDIYIYFVH